MPSLAWPDPFSRRALSIRDDKRPCEKGLVQFTALTRSRVSAWWYWVLIEIHKSNCVTVDYRKLTTPQFKANCVTIDQHPAPPCWVLERVNAVNWTRPFSQGRLSSLIDKALREKGSGHARLSDAILVEYQINARYNTYARDGAFRHIN